MDILSYQHFHLMGIKGVAMTALAQCLRDAGKIVTGSDLDENFVTESVLARLNLKIDHNFAAAIPPGTDCLIYTAAHEGPDNPQVQQAQAQGLTVLSHAQALASLFNQKKGLAVCGVGGKSTTSAMIAWILDKTLPTSPSFAVGVGDIPGLNKTGQWRPASEYFVAEADEYVIDPKAREKGQLITPRFSFMKPYVTVCTNLKFDHPDVYTSLEQTKQTYYQFFSRIKSDGRLIINADDPNLNLIELKQLLPETIIRSFGQAGTADLNLKSYDSTPGKTNSLLTFQNQEYALTLRVPGRYNVMNALAALLACYQVGVPIKDSITALASFNSTKRRFELVGEKRGVKFYDDYAHHPDELTAAITALREWFPGSRRVIAFQSHTFSRTKQLLTEFVQALSIDEEVLLIDIFPSAREKADPSVSSDLIVQQVKQHRPDAHIQNLHTIDNLAHHLQATLKPGDVVLTLGAGDIYLVHARL